MNLQEYMDKHDLEILSLWRGYPFLEEQRNGNIIYKKYGKPSTDKDPVGLLRETLRSVADTGLAHIELSLARKKSPLTTGRLAISHIPSYCGGIFFGYVASFIYAFGNEAFKDLLQLIEEESCEPGLLFMSMLNEDTLEDMKEIGYKKYGSHINPRTGNELYIIGWEL